MHQQRLLVAFLVGAPEDFVLAVGADGQGFGLGFAVRTDAGRNPLPGSVGTYYWTGAYGTTFFVDPKQKLIVIMMIEKVKVRLLIIWG